MDRAVVVWCLTPVEVWSGVSCRRPERALGSPEMREARHRLQLLADADDRNHRQSSGPGRRSPVWP